MTFKAFLSSIDASRRLSRIDTNAFHSRSKEFFIHEKNVSAAMNEKKTFVVRSAAFRWFLDEIVRLNQSFLLILPSTSNAICLQVWLKIKSGANKRWFSISVENVDGSEIFDFILFI